MNLNIGNIPIGQVVGGPQTTSVFEKPNYYFNSYIPLHASPELRALENRVYHNLDELTNEVKKLVPGSCHSAIHITEDNWPSNRRK